MKIAMLLTLVMGAVLVPSADPRAVSIVKEFDLKVVSNTNLKHAGGSPVEMGMFPLLLTTVHGSLLLAKPSVPS